MSERLACGGCSFVYLHSVDAGLAQLVERNLAKVEVAGSSPVSRSRPSFPEGLFFIGSSSVFNGVKGGGAGHYVVESPEKRSYKGIEATCC